ncbi:response regulator transcription factor [Clostridium estertheticum]|uniref:response regulator transcription factor n=1 Tax=Clostridium estertheticum TaxID=238834 RepID=UPI001C7CC5C1|nr:response regulator transcription factor [Clostridium estertheticum]MBX4260502.1 response regulator transcription factor [Clostridium estertheticum]MCB2357084.1 response regulator transcription factor [Clostridium estertheticum]WAG43789.1 response regulator transcription factor [Clostridium estertheticum]WLC72926.1 response regulator transcription factor [Clostridium estertheticum]
MNNANNVKILLVEDDKEINTLVYKILLTEGFDIVQVYDGIAAMDNFKFDGTFQLVILDLMIPYIDGFEVIRRIRQKSIVPILIISSKNTEMDKVAAISMGGDDYIVKPFSLNEFIVRVKALLRRYIYFNNEQDSQDSIINYKDLVINMNDYTIVKKGNLIKSTPTEFEIFKLFLLNPNKVFTKSQIYDSIWGIDAIKNDNTIMVHIKRLRDKIEDDINKQEYITTVWGIGYRLGDLI